MNTIPNKKLGRFMLAKLVAFDRVIEQCNHNKVRLAFRHLRETIKEGGSFYDAMESYPKLFPARLREVFGAGAEGSGCSCLGGEYPKPLTFPASHVSI